MNAYDPDAWLDRVALDAVTRPLIESAKPLPGRPAPPDPCPLCRQRNLMLPCRSCGAVVACLPCCTGGVAGGGYFCRDCETYWCADCLASDDMPAELGRHIEGHLAAQRLLARREQGRRRADTILSLLFVGAFAAVFAWFCARAI